MNATTFKEFMNKNRDVCYALAKANTPKNSQGRPCIKKDDEWANENCWDEYYKKSKGTHLIVGVFFYIFAY